MPTDANSKGLEERLEEVVLHISLSLSSDRYKQTKAKSLLQEQHEKLAHIPPVCSMIQSIRASFEQNRRGICKFRPWSRS